MWSVGLLHYVLFGVLDLYPVLCLSFTLSNSRSCQSTCAPIGTQCAILTWTTSRRWCISCAHSDLLLTSTYSTSGISRGLWAVVFLRIRITSSQPLNFMPLIVDSRPGSALVLAFFLRGPSNTCHNHSKVLHSNFNVMVVLVSTLRSICVMATFLCLSFSHLFI